MSDYEDRKQARIERLEAAAERAAAKAGGLFNQAREQLRHHTGEPIKIGHHSERRHRRDLERHDSTMRRAFNTQKQAEHLERRAQAAANNTAISSDDPEAVTKLEAKLAKMEEQRTKIKEFNKAARKAGTETQPGWVLSNLGANIRRVKQRIEQLKREQAVPAAAPVLVGGFTLVEDKEINRVQLKFNKKPGPDTRRVLKTWGFRWAPSQGAWQRQLNNTGRHAAQVVAREIAGKEDQ